MQLVDVLNLLDGATKTDYSFGAYKTKETFLFFPYEKFNHLEKLNQSKHTP